MHHGHHVIFVALSVVIAVFGAWTALDLFRRVRSHIGQAQSVWLVAAAVVMGASIWSMHFVAMLGFDPGSPVSYDPALTVLSLLVAIAATSGAFFAASRQGTSSAGVIVAGCAMGTGICLMHYLGMAALQTAASLGYRPLYVVASFVIAVVTSTAALFAGRLKRSIKWRAVAAVTLGLAVVGMHYTAMAGLRLTKTADAVAIPGAPPFLLGVAVATSTLIILVLALLASLYDQRLNVLSALDGGDVGYWELTLKDMTLHMSPRAKQILGGSPDEPFGYQDLLAHIPAHDHERRQAALNRAIAEGGAYDIEYRLQLGDRVRWVNTRGRVVAWANGKPQRMAGVVLDITDRHDAYARLAEAEGRQRLLIDELNHRVKNTLATVQSIARQSAKGADSMLTFREGFESRLMSLSSTHNLLTRASWEQASLRELLQQEVAPHAANQIVLEGEDIQLTPRYALAFGMIFHELTTNAAKYGALSSAAGRLLVRWDRDPGANRLTVDWREFGGPSVAAPSRRGFGSTLIERLAIGELDGRAEVDFAQDGLRCRIEVPLSAALATSSSADSLET